MNDLERFIKAQEKDYWQALQEIKNGKKQTHWIWYIFPQLKGLGTSTMANYYGIKDLAEAQAYLKNAYLKHNLIEISEALLALDSTNPIDVLGYPDNLKVQSCMTLFYYTDSSLIVFKKVLEKFYNSQFDQNTLAKIKTYK